jgi:hypothetical protein
MSTSSSHLRQLASLATARRTVVLGAAGLGLGAATLTAAGALGHPRGPAGAESSRALGAASATDILEAEIDALVDAGLADDHPRVSVLRDDLADLEGAVPAPGPVAADEPGVDLGEILGPPGRGARSADPQHADSGPRDVGLVQCEPVPPDQLTAEEIDAALCASVPRPDGGTDYAALAPDGTLRIVRFGPDDTVTRLPDQRIDPGNVGLSAIEATVNALG